ncbi:hypothetical protein BDV24DRAFT_138341 [Aspergillus arachidicola]|uniref:Uncharacterized protein n=1 Tax=Aspergillus arachidicola TaxID=656916 RepID=A0A5N6Y1S8_9EURO|nr:hypothetical protein BDV24DRAFT_138341 [Aspergillus arachidicola]
MLRSMGSPWPGLAPFSSNSLTMPSCPPLEAYASGVQPLSSPCSIFAPFSTSSLNIPSCPFLAAQINGV